MTRNTLISFGAIVAIIVTVLAWKKISNTRANVIVTKVAQRNAGLQVAVDQLTASSSCAKADDKPKCFVQFVVSQGGINYATDLGLYSGAALGICGPRDVPCRFELMDRLILLINAEKIKSTVESEVANQKDSNFRVAFDVQFNFLIKFLNTHRTVISRHLENVEDPLIRANYTRFLVNIDAQLAKLSGK